MPASAQREHPQGPTLGAAPVPAGFSGGCRCGPWPPVCENRLDGSAACPPITSGFSPPGYNLVLSGCRHPRAVPLAFGDSAQFNGLAQYCRGQRCQRRLPGRCVASARVPGSPTAHPATTATAGLGMRVDPDWSACPPTRPAEHTPAQKFADSTER